MIRIETVARLKVIGIIGLILTIASIPFGYTYFTVGVALGTCISMINFLIMYRALIKGEKNPETAQKIFIKSYLIRFFVSLGALMLSLFGGPPMILGMMTGLYTYVLSYAPEALRIIISGGKG